MTSSVDGSSDQGCPSPVAGHCALSAAASPVPSGVALAGEDARQLRIVAAEDRDQLGAERAAPGEIGRQDPEERRAAEAFADRVMRDGVFTSARAQIEADRAAGQEK